MIYSEEGLERSRVQRLPGTSLFYIQLGPPSDFFWFFSASKMTMGDASHFSYILPSFGYIQWRIQRESRGEDPLRG